MNFLQLRYFLIVAEEEHITRAAEKLHIAQPSLSTSVRRLEKELGVPLFDRQGRNIVLNANGRKLQKHAQYIFNRLDRLHAELEEASDNIHTRLVLAVNNSLYMNNWLRNFVSENPGIRLWLKMLSEEDMIDALRNESVDIALGEFSTNAPDIACREILQDEYIVLVPVDHHLADRKRLSFEDIRTEPFVALPAGATSRIIDKLFAQKNEKPNIVFEGHQHLLDMIMKQSRALLFSSRQMAYLKSEYSRSAVDPRDCYQAIPMTISGINTRGHFSMCWKQERPLPIMAEKFKAAMTSTYPLYCTDERYLAQKVLHIPFAGKQS